jgi:transcription termination factor NusB
MELVRKYSTKESPNFVNGILAEYKKQLENWYGITWW